ncbi:MAG: hypothetical protein CMI16_12690 [Opitutaceae bacterium]|nr:hypothetical protein [Opitutaceae bacterium]
MSVNVDTFSDVPPEFLNPLCIQQLFAPFENMCGVIFSGLASSEYKGQADWGASLRLTEEESLQIRVHPRGCFSAGRIVDLQGVVMLAARRTGSRVRDHVSLAILWTPPAHMDLKANLDHDSLQHSTVGCRNLHVVLPSLFNHHDACAYNDHGRLNPQYPVLDDYNYHAVRPSSVTVTQNPAHNGVHGRFCVSTGISQFVIAGHFAGLDVEDVVHRAAEPIPHARWTAACQHYASMLHGHAGTQGALLAMHNSMTAIELLTCEGLLGVLSHQFVEGVLPDMLHVPNGMPLLIAFAVRVACYPERFGLHKPTKSDEWGNQEVCSLFESNWKSLDTDATGEVKFYALDAAIKSGFKDATDAAVKMGTRQAVIDNLSFWHRAGQRCISSIFGSQITDYFPPKSPYGRCDALQDPLGEARQQAMRNSIDPTDFAAVGDSAVALNLCSAAQKKHTLLLLLSSVEGWLRTGRYCTQQLSAKNSPDCGDQNSPSSTPRTFRKREFQRLLDKGVDASVQEMLEAGECDHEEDARVCANAVRDTIEHCLSGHSADTRVAWIFPESVDDSRNASRRRKEATVLSAQDVCVAATTLASSAIAAAFCQVREPLVISILYLLTVRHVCVVLMGRDPSFITSSQ